MPARPPASSKQKTRAKVDMTPWKDTMNVPPLSKQHKDILRKVFNQATRDVNRTIARVQKIAAQSQWDLFELNAALANKGPIQAQRNTWMASNAWKGIRPARLPTGPVSIPNSIRKYANTQNFARAWQRTGISYVQDPSIVALRKAHMHNTATVPPLHSLDRQIILKQFKNALDSIDLNIAYLRGLLQDGPPRSMSTVERKGWGSELRKYINDHRQYKKYMASQQTTWVRSAAWQKRGASDLPIWPMNPFQVNVNASLQYPYPVKRTTVPQNIQRVFNLQKARVLKFF
jgi:hypothetical protein